MSNPKLSASLKLIVITLATGASTLGLSLLLGTTKLDHLWGIQQPKSESTKASQHKAMIASAQAASLAINQT